MNLQETIYPLLTQRLSEKNLKLNFTPTEADKAFVNQNTRNATNRTILLVMLKVTQYLRYVPPPSDIPYSIIKYISGCSDSHVMLQKQQLSEYENSGSHKRQAKLIRDYLQLEYQHNKIIAYCETVGVELAQTKENLVDILNALIESLIRESYELPAFTTLERLARQCRVRANELLYAQINQRLAPEDIASIQMLFSKTGDDTFSGWQRLKKQTDKPTPQNIQEFLDHLAWLKALAASLPSLHHLPVAKRQQFRDEAMALHSSDMRELKQDKCLTLAVALIQTQLTQALDDLGDIFIKTVQDVENKGQLAYQQYYFENRGQADQLIEQFQALLKAYQQAPDDDSKMAAVDALLVENIDALLQACNQHLARSQGNERPFIVAAYMGKRRLLFKILAALPLEVDPAYQRLIEMGEFLKALYEAHGEESIAITADQLDLNAFSAGWREMIVADPQKEQWTINRFCLEIAWLIHVKEQLKTFHCFIANSEKHGNANEQMISLDEYPELAAEYEQLTGIPSDGHVLAQRLKDELKLLSHSVDDKFPQVTGARLNKDGKLILKPAYINYSSPTLEGLRTAVAQKMPRVSIIDAITDTVRWLKLDTFFRPHSGHASKLDDPLFRLVVTLFCFGCNVGAQQTAESIKSLSRKQVSWLNARHASLNKLEKAIKKVVDTYAQMELPKQWGDGSHASADGTHKQTYDANLLSEFHFRYRKKGAVGYYLVSDKYIALFSHFIACGAHESWYILDGVANNDMDIQPSILHGDTHAQNYVVFGLAYLLGIQLMPRIRGIKHLKFFKPTPNASYKNLGSLFSGTVQWHYIEKHLPDMLRIVLSIKKGTITPSAILRRLNTYSSKNSLYMAFQELGKAVRTLFLLRIIDDIELRKIIHRETNKTEQHHAFSGWLFFGNGGIIRHNDLFDQEKILKYHHLVSNLVALFNTHHMTKALESLKQEGYPIVLEDVKHISPYSGYGINLLGSYQPDLKKKLEPMAITLDLTD